MRRRRVAGFARGVPSSAPLASYLWTPIEFELGDVDVAGGVDGDQFGDHAGEGDLAFEGAGGAELWIASGRRRRRGCRRGRRRSRRGPGVRIRRGRCRCAPRGRTGRGSCRGRRGWDLVDFAAQHPFEVAAWVELLRCGGCCAGRGRRRRPGRWCRSCRRRWRGFDAELAGAGAADALRQVRVARAWGPQLCSSAAPSATPQPKARRNSPSGPNLSMRLLLGR